MNQNVTAPRIIPNASDLGEELWALFATLRRGWRIIAVSVLICLTIVSLSLATTKRIYQATTRLLILQQGSRPLNVANSAPNQSPDGTDDYIPTHAVIVRSPLVVASAIAAVGLDQLPSLAKADNPTREAIGHMTVTRPDRTAKVIQLDYQAGSRQEAVRFVSAVAESYRKFLESRYQKNNNDVITLITRAREGLKLEMEDLEKKYFEFRRKNPVLTTDETGRSFIFRRLEHWDRAANEATIRKIQLKAQLNLGRKLVKDGTGLWAVAHAMSLLGGESGGGMLAQAVGNNQGIQSDYVRQLSQEQQQLAERFGPRYSKVRELQDQIGRVQESVRESRSRLDQVDSRDLLGSIEESLKVVEAMHAEFVKKFTDDLAEAKGIEMDLMTEANLKENLERHRALFNTVVDQLKQAELVGDFNSISSEAIEPANALQYPVRPRVGMTLTLALVAGCVFGAGSVVVADRMAQRVRSVDEMKQIIEWNVLGLIPELADNQKALAGSVGRISQTLPRSSLAEAFKAARTNLEVIRRGQPAQVLLVTSPTAGDGKSTVASNLAISLAQAGRKVLLIDADLRCPTQYRIHNVPREPGLVHLLRSAQAIGSSALSSNVENLELVLSGREVHDPAELLMSSRLSEIIAEARQAHDVVIIDSSPILAVTDAAIIGTQVDGILLVVRVSATKRQNARRAVELLKGLGTPILGTIINGIGVEWGGYGYGYGDGYVYGHGPRTSGGNEIVPQENVLSPRNGGTAAAGTNGFAG